MMSRPIEEIWNILNDLEDELEGGFRDAHPPLPKTAAVKVARGAPQAEAAGRVQVAAKLEAGRGPQAKTVGPQPVDAPGADLLKAIEHEVRNCTRCELGFGRKNAVPGMGPGSPDVFVIGEGPGAEEDGTGLPFVGPAGRYLDKWLTAVGLSRETNTFIGNIVKCRPPGNRDPRPEESSACLPYLIRQIEILRPRAILTLGRIATQVLLNTSGGIGATRGRLYRFHEIPLVATYHPSGVLRNPEYRREVWEDLKLLRSVLDEESAE